jgi:hypothetical protein
MGTSPCWVRIPSNAGFLIEVYLRKNPLTGEIRVQKVFSLNENRGEVSPA